MEIPLINRIRKESHRKIAAAQDIILEEVYNVIPNSVLHGGTLIWRSYNGKRFSEDLDFYFPKEDNKIDMILKNLEKKGFQVLKRKISERSVYSELSYDGTAVRLEATFQKVNSSLVDYEKINGATITIYGLTPEQIIKEKVTTYLNRRKIRDLYDIFFLLKLVINHEEVKKDLKEIIDKYSPPIDENDLKVIILEGLIPTSDEILNYIKRKWQNPNI